MLVKEWMATDPITVDENTSIMKATQLMKEHSIRRLPVVRRDTLVGIVSDRDIKEAAPSKATSLDVHELYYLLSEIKAKDIMTPRPITLRENDSVGKAAVIMLENRISGLPVIDDERRVVGLITQSDIFKVMISITGVFRGPIVLACDIEDRPGSMSRVLAVVRSHDGRVVSVTTCYEHMASGRRGVYIRIMDMPEKDLQALVDDLKREVRVLYVVREDLSEIPRKVPKSAG